MRIFLVHKVPHGRLSFDAADLRNGVSNFDFESLHVMKHGSGAIMCILIWMLKLQDVDSYELAEIRSFDDVGNLGRNVSSK